MEEYFLVIVLVASAFIALIGFMIGERRRGVGDSSQEGARPCRSIGEALLAGKRKHGRVLILFLGDDEPGVAAKEALANDPAVITFLSRAEVFHAVISTADRMVANALFSKYAKEPLPEGPTLLLLDPQGLPVEVARIAERGPMGTWLADWVLAQPRQGRQISSPEEEVRQSGEGKVPGDESAPPETKGPGDDSPVAFK
jgi:hypothetical protein